MFSSDQRLEYRKSNNESLWSICHIIRVIFQFQQHFFAKLDNYAIYDWFICRLNSGIFRLFEPSECNLNLKNLDCRAWKIIGNDTKAEPIPWELNIEIPRLNFCVGVWVDGHPQANCSHRPFHIFWYQCRRRGRQREMVWNEKLTKNWKLGLKLTYLYDCFIEKIKI